MSSDVTAQIIAKAWSDCNFAQALKGPDAYAAIQEALGVSLPARPPLAEAPDSPVPSRYARRGAFDTHRYTRRQSAQGV